MGTQIRIIQKQKRTVVGYVGIRVFGNGFPTVFVLVEPLSSIGLGFLNLSSQLRCTDVPAFCMQLGNQLVR